MAINFKMKSDSIYLAALGGCGVFGANMSLYGYQGKWIMVDCGLGFADDTMPGIDIVLPNPQFAASLGDDLLGIIITHSHEDHIGAIRHLWAKFKTPIYATKFNLARIEQAVSERPWGSETMLNEVPLGGNIKLDSFDIDFINMAHSVPQASSLAISVKDVGTILHTGDWKIDSNPVEGDVTDESSLKKLGDNNLLALVGDSTNAMVEGHSGSEIDVQKSLINLFSEFKAKIAITCFSTSVARISSISKAAKANGRYVCLVGRSLKNIDEIARNSGYLKGVLPFIDEEEAAGLSADKIVYICTGSQGEPRAALTRIANKDYKHVTLGKGDVVIFSSRNIPGNEKSINRVKNNFQSSGVSVVTSHDTLVHCSGHPYRDELKELYSWVKPKSSIPVHGEIMMQEKHYALAKECGVENILVPNNGDILEINKSGRLSIVDNIEVSALAVEGNRIIAIDHEAILMRKRIMYNGSAIVTIVIDDEGFLIAEPKVTALGLLDDASPLDIEYINEVIEEIKDSIEVMPDYMRSDDAKMSENIRITTRRFFKTKFELKPQTRVHLVRV